MGKQSEKQKLWKQKEFQENRVKHNNKQTARRREIKEYLDSLKNVCITCGETDIASLDFHHVNADEKGDTVSKATTNKWGNKKIDEEVAKCVVLCSNCHRKLHYYNLSVEGVIEYIKK